MSIIPEELVLTSNLTPELSGSSNLDESALTSNLTPQLSSSRFLFNYNFILGTSSNDYLNTTFRNDIVVALEGNDTIKGSFGNDFILGGTGNDIVDYSKLGQAITLEAAGIVKKGSAGIDRISEVETIIGANGKANVIDASTGTSGTTSLFVNLLAQSLAINNIPVPGISSLNFTVKNFRNVIGTSRNDVIIGDNFNNKLEGGAGNDIILGLGGNDTVSGGAGNDTVNAGSGNDLLIGGTGFDSLDGGTGFDTVDYSGLSQAITLESAGRVNKGFAGNDRLNNVEKIVGTQGRANVIDASTGTSTTTTLDVNLAAQKLVINNVPGVGSLNFQVQNFRNVIGTSRNDSIIGDKFNNVLEGGAGNDTISGNGGKDVLIGVDTDSFNPGRNEIDILSGGTGADKFVVGDKKDTYYTGGGGFFGLNDFAFLSDFETGQDKIQLSKSDSYIFGSNFIAVRNFFKPFPILLESSEASTDSITGVNGDALMAQNFESSIADSSILTSSIADSSVLDSSIADSAVDNIIKSGGVFETLSLGAETEVAQTSLKSSSSLIAPIPFPSFDIVAIVADDYNFSDIQFV